MKVLFIFICLHLYVYIFTSLYKNNINDMKNNFLSFSCFVTSLFISFHIYICIYILLLKISSLQVLKNSQIIYVIINLNILRSVTVIYYVVLFL